MLKETGNKSFPIWIIGDSNPSNWENTLVEPFDSRHPIRHNIITSIFDVIQEKVYIEFKGRVATRQIYIKNAVQNAIDKPNRDNAYWSEILNEELNVLRNYIEHYKPIIVLSFGSFSFEFCRRCIESSRNKKYSQWSTKNLGEEFRKRVKSFDISKTNIFPLLHRSIAGGFFLQGHTNYCPKEYTNYFEYVGSELASLLIINRKNLHIWL